jgi:two-component system LytT family sensor kinase
MSSPKGTITQFKQKIYSFLNTYKYHFISWIVFMVYESVSASYMSNSFAPLLNYVAFYSLNITFFYFHANFVLDHILKGNTKSRLWKIPLALLIEVSGYTLVMILMRMILFKFTDIAGGKPFEINSFIIAGSIFRCIYFIGFATGYYYILLLSVEKKKTLELERQRMDNQIQLAKSENAYLKAQINPHFLFNTLDFIYQHAKGKSPVAAETILSLSAMMRSAVDHVKEDEYIDMGQEIDQVENLINLHQLRKNHQLHLRFWYDEEIRSAKIIPLVLVTLIENIFKHGNLHLESDPACVSIGMKDNRLLIETNNLINDYPNSNGLGSGMNNISKRLSYTYGPAASFAYGIDQEKRFKVELLIPHSL